MPGWKKISLESGTKDKDFVNLPTIVHIISYHIISNIEQPLFEAIIGKKKYPWIKNVIFTQWCNKKCK